MFAVSHALGVCSTGVKSSGAHGSGVQDFGAHVPLQGIRGSSVLFHLTKYQDADPEEVSWGFGPESNYTILLRFHRGADTPTWVSLQDKYQDRVHVPSVSSLRIMNLTREDSGEYRTRASFPEGRELTQVFLLTVYGELLLLTPPYGFPPAFVLGVSHKPHFSGSLPDTSLQTPFRL